MSKVDGYTCDVVFPAFFYKEMQPLWLSSITTQLGFEAPDTQQPFSMCELGCGVGINLLVAAACHPQARFVGVDFNPQHIQIARAAAASAGLRNIQFEQAGFAEFAQAGKRGQDAFDFMTSHGVWSWIAPQHQQALLGCVQHRLHAGGVFYLHYMCHPGATEWLNVQHFLHLFAPHVPGTSAQRVQLGLKLLRQLASRGMFHERPAVVQLIERLQRKDAKDLAHEFLTDHWQPQHSVSLHEQVGRAGLHYVGSAEVFNNLGVELSVPRNMQAVVQQTKIPALVETLKDLARNSHQRMDLFVREPVALSAWDYQAKLQAMSFAKLPAVTELASIQFDTPIGPIQGPPALCTPVLQHLAHGPASFGQLQQLPVFDGQQALLLQTLQLMMMQGIVHPAQPIDAQAKRASQALEDWFQQQELRLRVLPGCGTAWRTVV